MHSRATLLFEVVLLTRQSQLKKSPLPDNSFNFVNMINFPKYANVAFLLIGIYIPVA
jgi:hypothetical protein